MASHYNQIVVRYARKKVDFQKRLEETGWGVFLLMIGVLLMLPSEFVPRGAWLVGAGMIMLGLNCIRYLNNIAVSRFTLVLGSLAIIAGLIGFFGVTLLCPKSHFKFLVTASPPDVRQGFALPSATKNFTGLCPQLGLSARKCLG